MQNDFKITYRFAQLLTEVASTTLSLDVERIYYLVNSFQKDNINVYDRIANEIADHQLKVNKVLVKGETNNIALYEVLNSYLDIDWFDFVGEDSTQEKIRKAYFDVNDIDVNYSWINCAPEDYSEYDTEYDLVVSIDHLYNVECGPTYAFISSASTKLIKKETNIEKVWASQQWGDQNLVMGYLPV